MHKNCFNYIYWICLCKLHKKLTSFGCVQKARLRENLISISSPYCDIATVLKRLSQNIPLYVKIIKTCSSIENIPPTDTKFDNNQIANESISILLFFSSKEECTYLFSVVLTSLCPKISESVFTSIPASIHLVAKVCLSV